MSEVDKFSKAPDHISPPISYMKACGAFKPLATNMPIPWAYARFYCTWTPPVRCQPPLPTIRLPSIKLKCLLGKAQEQVWPYIIVVFEDSNVTPLGLLLELHSHYTLSHIPIFTAEEVRQAVTNPAYPVALFVPMSSRMTAHS